MTKRRTRREKLLDEINQMMGKPVGSDLDKMVAEAEAEAQQMLKEAMQSPSAVQLLKLSGAAVPAREMLVKAAMKGTT